MKHNYLLKYGVVLALMMVLTLAQTGCGGGGSTSPVSTTTTLSGIVSFPKVLTKPVASEKTVATLPTISLAVYELSGAWVKDVSVNQATGRYEVTVSKNNNYVLKATSSGVAELRSLVDQATLVTANPTVPVNYVTAAAIIAIETATGITPGSLGKSWVSTAEALTKIAATPPATEAAAITSAETAVTTPATATATHAKLATLASIVKQAVIQNVEPAGLFAGTNTTDTLTAVTTYTINNGTVAANSVTINADSAQAAATALLPFTITGKVTLHGTTNGVPGIAVYLKPVQATVSTIDSIIYNSLTALNTPSTLTATTADDGTYTFTGIAAGNYTIASPSDYGFLISNPGWKSPSDLGAVSIQFALKLTDAEVFLYSRGESPNSMTPDNLFVYNAEYIFSKISHTITLDIDATKKAGSLDGNI